MALKVAKKKKVPHKNSGKVTTMYNEKDLAKMAEEYSALSAKIKELTDAKTKLATELKSGAEVTGVQDDNGSFYAECGSFIIGKVAKKSIRIDQEKAVELFKKKKMEECIVRNVTYSVSEKDIEQSVQSGAISEDDVMSFTSVNTSYQVSVTKKEEMPEVQQSVASRKKR